MHADCFAGGKFETTVRDPILHAVYTQLHKSLCMWEELARIQRAKSSTNNDASEPFKTDLTILLISRRKRTGDKMLPWGTPISCSYVSDRLDPALTWNSRWDRNPSMKVGKWPRKSRSLKIGQYTVFPRSVVSLFQIEENGQNVFFFGKSITNVTIKSNQMAGRAEP